MITLKPELQRQYCRDFLSHHITRLRRSREIIPLTPEDDEKRFAEAPLYMDSLEHVYLAGLFADTVGLRPLGLEDLLLARPTVAGWQKLLDQALEQGLTEWGFFSSGSQGEPKLVYHPLNYLQNEVEELGEIICKFPIQQVVCLVPGHHIYGFLWSILFPSIFNLPVTHLSPIYSSFQEGDLIIATPYLVKQWKMRGILPPTESLTLVSTAPFEQALSNWLSITSRPWLEIYGSTETGGIGYRTDVKQGFLLLPYWDLQKDDAGQFVLIRDGRTFPFPDEVGIEGRQVFPVKRKDGAIQIGGVNVYPGRVKAFLESIPGVREAFIRTFEREDGLRLKAWIVPESEVDRSELEHRLKDLCEQNLLSVEKPVHFTINPTPPFSPMGKLIDW